ncbi:hypothetical protein M011DRAFT_379591, partial [Sporormia fimetaria CBS 119925]
PRTTSAEKLSLAASDTVYTYHCHCTHLLLATTTPLPALPVRQNSLDKAHIMPLPPAPTAHTRFSQEPKAVNHYGLLLSTALDGSAEMMQTDDGYEKRYLQRCGRCNVPVGYHLDWLQFEQKEKSGRREDLVYLFPGGLVSTSEMVMG